MLREKFPEFSKRLRSTALLLGLAGVGMLLLFLSSRTLSNRPPVQLPDTAGKTTVPCGKDDYRQRVEQELTSLLGKVKGVGRVVVLVTLESGPDRVYGENQEMTVRRTREEDGTGGSREIEENTSRTELVVTREGQGEKPLLLTEIKPRLRGVMVIAEGAEAPHLREQITLALQAGLGVAAHRITVLPMK